jgi:hypothetical protein
MSTDFDHLLASLTTDADRVRLAPASELRAAGDARTHRRFVAAASTLVLVVAILVGAGIAVAGFRPMNSEPMPIGPATSVSVPPNPSDEPTTPPSTTPPSSTAPPASSGAPCTAASLRYDSAVSQGAMGTAFTDYTFHNGGSVACTVQGLPELSYVDDSGKTATVPLLPGPVGEPVLVQPGKQVVFNLSEINGHGGYAPGAPECAHPATYRQVSVVLPGGSVSLRSDGTLSVLCGGITVRSWSRPGP